MADRKLSRAEAIKKAVADLEEYQKNETEEQRAFGASLTKAERAALLKDALDRFDRDHPK